MIDLARAVEQIIGKPIAGPSDIVQISDDGAGPYISRWDDSLGKQPSESELHSAWESYCAKQAASDLADAYISAAKKEQNKSIIAAAKLLAIADGKTDVVAILDER